jgi:hypothetical protein
MRRLLALLLLALVAATAARADLHITRDHGGDVEEYKARYQQIRDTRQRVIIDGICNSACTLVFGIVPPSTRSASRRAPVSVSTRPVTTGPSPSESR